MASAVAMATNAYQDLGLEFRPASGHIGAEIRGVDLSKPLTPEVVSAIRNIWLRWKVVFFRDQEISRDQHVAFGRYFGEVTPAHPTLPAAFPDHPEILLLDNRQSETMGGAVIENRWHTDVTFVPNPPMASILRGAVIPPYGGDTQWINLVVAYERLSESIRSLIDGLHAVHHNHLPISRGELSSEYVEKFQSSEIQSVHPMVRVHPETGEKALFVNPNFTSHVVELSRQEGRHLLAMLYEHQANPEFTARFRWEPGSLAFWDNRATAHFVPTDIPPGMHRSVERITLAGGLPVGPDGSESRALKGEVFNSSDTSRPEDA
ncbi:TauD/TfdA family dioxygenase [Myxococcota bacterium]|nr:TauD/TfdA family dioxygenase [Myxococcota bacterium]